MPSELAVPVRDPLESGIFSFVNGFLLHTALHNHPFFVLITKILLKMTQNAMLGFTSMFTNSIFFHALCIPRFVLMVSPGMLNPYV